MAKTFTSIDVRTRAFLEAQKVFFVATAPAGEEGHVNCSPKGLDSFRVLGPKRVAYLDLTGSGVETIAHVRENGRIVLMFCAFDGPPKIVRLWGRGEIIEPHDRGFARLAQRFGGADRAGARAIIRVDVSRVAHSCGYAVPLMKYEADRSVLDDAARRKGPEALDAYRREKNAASIDGLPGLRFRPAPRERS